MNNIVSASILSADMLNLEAEIRRLDTSGVDWIHFDVMDGVFVPNISYGLPILEQVRKVRGNMKLDVHLMITDPLKYIHAFYKAGADIITFHLESVSNTDQTIKSIKQTNCAVGIAIKPATPARYVTPYINENLAMVLIMTVEPGFGGQNFMDMSEKIAKIRKYANDNGFYDLLIEVDGGIDDKTAAIVKKAGANAFVSGSYLFNSVDIVEAVSELKEKK